MTDEVYIKTIFEQPKLNLDKEKICDIDYLIWYGDTKLSDLYYIENVGIKVNDEFITSGKCKCWVYGKATKGSYLITSLIYGVAISKDAPEMAFGRCLEDKPDYSIGLVEFEFIRNDNA